MIEPLDFHDLLRRRRSRRAFTAREIEPEKVERALTAAMRAPSGANSQPWEYVLIERGPIREKIRDACLKADRDFHERSPEWLREFFKAHEITPVKQFTELAPMLVAVFGRRDHPFWLQSVWLSVASFVYALEVEGLHSLLYTPSLTKEFNRLIGVEEELSCQAVIPVGYADPDEKITDRPRKSPAEKVRVVGPDGDIRPYKKTLPFDP